MVVYAGIEFVKVFLNVEGMVGNNISAVFYAGVVADQVRYSGIEVRSSARVCKANYLISAKLGEVKSVLLDLTDNLGVIGNTGKSGMGEGVSCYLVSCIYVFNVLGLYLIM